MLIIYVMLIAKTIHTLSKRVIVLTLYVAARIWITKSWGQKVENRDISKQPIISFSRYLVFMLIYMTTLYINRWEPIHVTASLVGEPILYTHVQLVKSRFHLLLAVGCVVEPNCFHVHRSSCTHTQCFHHRLHSPQTHKFICITKRDVHFHACEFLRSLSKNASSFAI